MNRLTDEIGTIPITTAEDWQLASVLNDTLNLIDNDRQVNGYTSYRDSSLEDRVLLLENALLTLATIVSRRLSL